MLINASVSKHLGIAVNRGSDCRSIRLHPSSARLGKEVPDGHQIASESTTGTRFTWSCVANKQLYFSLCSCPFKGAFTYHVQPLEYVRYCCLCPKLGCFFTPETFFHTDTKPLQVTLPTAEHFKWNPAAIKCGVTLLRSASAVMDYLGKRLLSSFCSVSRL